MAASLGGNMAGASEPDPVLTKQQRIAEVARQAPQMDHACLRDLLMQRLRDGVVLRLIDKWLNAGVLEDGDLSYPEAGTPQGLLLSTCSSPAS
jgi:hypothetical protein